MSDCKSLYETHCKGHFAAIHKKLDLLDNSLRGNGKPGIQLRLDRLEQSKANFSRILWLLIGSAITIIARIIYLQVTGS